MKKNNKQLVVWSIVLLFAVTQSGWVQRIIHGEALATVVYAEDEEDDEEDDDEDSGTTTSSSSSGTSSGSTKAVTTYKTVYVDEVVTTLDPIYTTDTDKDGLVDGLDPHPTIVESEYFTDIDGDGVPNAFDRHHDEDDFIYFEEEVDTNNNGVLDSYEPVAVP